MSFLLFALYFFICTLILFLIVFLILKFLVKKKCFTFSKLAEKEIDNYFHAYDDNINNTINELMEGMNNANSINREARHGENIDPNEFRL